MTDILHVDMEFLYLCVKVLVAKQHETAILHSLLNASLIDTDCHGDMCLKADTIELDCSLLYHCGSYAGSTICGLYLRMLGGYGCLNFLEYRT